MGSPDLVAVGRTLMPSLFDPIRLGAIAAPNRIIMAPLTRGRATREHVPTPLMAEYYAQRAGAGLIISEATGISQQGLGWPYAPGLWNAEQVAAWRAALQQSPRRVPEVGDPRPAPDSQTRHSTSPRDGTQGGSSTPTRLRASGRLKQPQDRLLCPESSRRL